jgi:hypothetical protein
MMTEMKGIFYISFWIVTILLNLSIPFVFDYTKTHQDKKRLLIVNVVIAFGLLLSYVIFVSCNTGVFVIEYVLHFMFACIVLFVLNICGCLLILKKSILLKIVGVVLVVMGLTGISIIAMYGQPF